ncbi:riboflavin kinase [Lingula anatina]|uniref:Riboflavin kinase n=1 Tax=Lingula anatina TaxID=7574 RepID=A0A1S3HJ39_LINAN|nr:riboflavin kinase [Lingula anatina]|eukprot:XP_013385009.1 riboflavin kinase [Lingula anatina]
MGSRIKMFSCFPYFSEGVVVKGFGRGSKELGIPTANYPENVVEHLPKEVEGGVYFGWANVDNGPVHKMVMSIGYNPYYHNKMKTMETHIMHDFKKDFYGSMLKTVMLGYVRPMLDFKSLDELIEAIQSDIKEADKQLEKPEFKQYQNDSFFFSNEQRSR